MESQVNHAASRNISAHLWKSIALASALECVTEVGIANAADLTAIVVAGKEGIVGSTEVLTGDVTGPLSGEGSDLSVVNSVGGFSFFTRQCQSTSSSFLGKGSTNVYGFRIVTTTGAATGAVLLPHGLVTWERQLLDNTVVKGNVSYQQGRWVNSWSVPVAGQTQILSASDGVSSGTSVVACPKVPQARWNSSYIRSSSFKVRFLVDAPAGGLAPGIYKLSAPPLYYIDSSDSANSPGGRYQNVGSDIEIKAADYSCTLSTDKSVINLAADLPTSAINLGVACSKLNGSAPAKSAWLYATASGVSTFINSGSDQQLGVANSAGLMTIRGSWSATPPANCSDTNTTSTMHFSDTIGKNLGNIISSGLSTTQKAAFRLCTTGNPEPGAYTAQATFSLVQK